ncbi:MAG: hypothetical protein EA397_03955 [Deltaproteobacteria bacterium]|nr:MAG: hypothetical protein EA397_03955 [Deltaproteobacteria bacterium]
MRVDEGAWPLLDDPRDPWFETWPDDDLGYADLHSLSSARPVPEAEYREAALALQTLLTEVLRGERALDPEALRAACRRAQVAFQDGRVDTRPLVVGPYRIPEQHVARIALDADPAAGLFGPDAALGPFEVISDRLTSVYALAHWATGKPTEHPPLQVWRRARLAPPRRDREAVTAAVRAPLGLWRVYAEGAQWRMQDLLGLSEHRRPALPLPLDHAAGLGQLRDGAMVLARLVPVKDVGFCAWAPLVLPADPPVEAARAWLHVLLTAHRLRNRRATPADVLREHAADFCRLAHHWCWAQGQELGR